MGDKMKPREVSKMQRQYRKALGELRQGIRTHMLAAKNGVRHTPAPPNKIRNWLKQFLPWQR